MNTLGTGPTTGTVTVIEFPSGNLNGFIILSGANWNCAALSCTRNDSLAVGASYPPITVSVTLAADGSLTVPNMATVAGGGLTSASSTDAANVTPAFTDVVTTDSFLPAIDLLRESGITKGCSPSTYCGDASITQAQMSSGTTQVSAGPGITVSNVSVASATTLSVQFAAAVGAATGPRSVAVTTGTEEATLPNMLTVIPHP